VGQKGGSASIKSSLWRTQRNDTITSAATNLHYYGATHWLQAYTKSKFWTFGGRREKAPALSHRSEAPRIMILLLRQWQVYIPTEWHTDFKHTLKVKSERVVAEERRPNIMSSLRRTQGNDNISSAVGSLHSYRPTHKHKVHAKSKFWTCSGRSENAPELSHGTDAPSRMIL
jgi:hypothetical protein